MIALRKRTLLIGLLPLIGLVGVGIGLEEYANMDWAGPPEGDVNPILIKRSLFGQTVIFNKVTRDNGAHIYSEPSTLVSLEGTIEKKPGSSLTRCDVFVSGDTPGVLADEGYMLLEPNYMKRVTLIPMKMPRSARAFHWQLHASQSPDYNGEEIISFSTPNPGRITKSNGVVLTPSVQFAPPLAVTLDHVLTTEAIEREASPALVWNDWSSVTDWLRWCVGRRSVSVIPSESLAKLAWTPQADWMPVADCVYPNFGPPDYPQDSFKDNCLQFNSLLWPEDGPYGVDLVFGHFHEVTGPVNLTVPSSVETLLHQSYAWGKTSLELLSVRSGDKNHLPRIVMRLRGAALIVDEHDLTSNDNIMIPVNQPLNLSGSIKTAQGYPLITLNPSLGTSWRTVGSDCFKTGLPDQPIEVTCDFMTTIGDPVSLSFILMDDVRMVHFGIVPTVVKPRFTDVEE